MFRCTPFFVGAAVWAFASSAPAVTEYKDQFATGTIGTEWDFSGVHYGAPVILTTNPTALSTDPGPPNLIPTNFLGEFGGAQIITAPNVDPVPILGDVVKLHLNLPQTTTSVSLKFDLYLLRTWDGTDVNYAGPDTFGYGYNDTTLLPGATFSNGQGDQSYCPGAGVSRCQAAFGSDIDAKNRLGFKVLLDPPPGVPSQKGDPMSLLYHITSDPIAYSGDAITFFFFSEGLQLTTDPTLPVADESWGIGGVNVTVTTAIPEPAVWTLMLLGTALLALSIRPRHRE